MTTSGPQQLQDRVEPIVREFGTEDGTEWEAIAIDAVVAHGKVGAVLAMRAAGDPEAEPIRTTITFNSRAAADFALRTMGVKELRRRLSLARTAAAGL
jgi:broad specificity phosphatase PhoE